MNIQSDLIDDHTGSGVIELKQSLKEFLSKMLFSDFLESAIAVIDTECRVLFQNSAFARLSQSVNSRSTENTESNNMFALETVQHAARKSITERRKYILHHTLQIDHQIKLELTLVFQPIKTAKDPSIQALLVTIGEESIMFDKFHIAKLRQDKQELAERIKVISRDLMQKNKLVHDLLRETPFAIMLIDRNRNVIQMNKACEKLFATTTRESTGMKCDHFLHCYQNNNSCPLLDHGSQIKLTETNCGSFMPDTILLRSAVVLKHENENDIILEAFIDITDRKRDEEELKKHRIQLQSLVDERTRDLKAINEELEAFCYSVSHDLRTPIRSISGFSAILLDDYGNTLDEEGKNYLNHVQQASFRMNDLMDDLLSLSRLTRDKYSPTKMAFDKLCITVWKQLTDNNKAQNIEFIVQDGIQINGDERMLHILLENLLGNAIKFTAAKPVPKISVGTETRNDEKIIFIKDNGAGFDMRYYAKLFQPFERLHDKSEFEGNGIGLAIVKRIINRHGGRIWAESEVEKGTTFYFTLG